MNNFTDDDNDDNEYQNEENYFDIDFGNDGNDDFYDDFYDDNFQLNQNIITNATLLRQRLELLDENLHDVNADSLQNFYNLYNFTQNITQNISQNITQNISQNISQNITQNISQNQSITQNFSPALILNPINYDDNDDDNDGNDDTIYNYSYRNYSDQFENLATEITNNLFSSLFTNFTDFLEDELLRIDNLEDIKVTLSEEEFNNLHQITYKDTDNKQCNICLDEFDLDLDLDLDLINLKCNHAYHKICIKEWLTKQSTKCPTCRTDTRDK